MTKLRTAASWNVYSMYMLPVTKFTKLNQQYEAVFGNPAKSRVTVIYSLDMARVALLHTDFISFSARSSSLANLKMLTMKQY